LHSGFRDRACPCFQAQSSQSREGREGRRQNCRNAPKAVVNTAIHAGDAVTHSGRTIEGVGNNIKQTAKDASHGKFKPAAVMAVAVPVVHVASKPPARRH
jgi:hypothetical protein